MNYWRLSSFYFLYFGFLGLMLPFWSLYLQSVGFGARAIGTVMATMAAVRVLTPNFWGWLADRSRQRLLIIRSCCVLALLSMSGLLFDHRLAWVLGVVTLHTFFWNAILAQYEAMTLSSLRDQLHRYGQVRLWGSVSFVLTVMLGGAIFDRISVVHLPWLLLLVLLAVSIGSFVLEDPPPAPQDTARGGLRGVLSRPGVLAFLFASFLLQVSHGPYYTFFSVYLDNHGFSRVQIGQFWSLGVLAEIALFAVVHRLLRRYSLRSILLLSLALTTLRWLLIAFGIGSVTVLIVAQCLHAASYGSYHAASVELLRREFGERHQGQGQALYGSASYGAGGAAGAMASGMLWEFSEPLTFALAAAAALLAWILVLARVNGAAVSQAGWQAGTDRDG